jgi:hypothetical protein
MLKVSTKLSSLVLAATLITPFTVQAESTTATGAGSLSTSARVDFSIVIPRILFLRVGSTGATIDPITFTVPAANVGNATAQAGTGGNLGAGAVTAIVQGNAGNATLTVSSIGALQNGAGGTINYTEIVTTATALAGFGTLLNAPALANGTGGTVALTAAANIVNSGATWTYTYANTTVPASGTYGGVNTQNSRVTYTVTAP